MGVQIPEGNVSAISIGETHVWQEIFEEIDSWDLEWSYGGNLPSQSVWSYPNGEGEAGNSAQTGSMFLRSLWGDIFASISPTSQLGAQRCVFETEIMAEQMSDSTMLYVWLTDGGDNVYVPMYLICRFEKGAANSMKLYVGKDGKFPTKANLAAEAALNTWHTLRLMIDKESGVQRIYLNGRLVAVRSNDDLYFDTTGYTRKSPEVGVYSGTVNIRALRYKAL